MRQSQIAKVGLQNCEQLKYISNTILLIIKSFETAYIKNYLSIFLT